MIETDSNEEEPFSMDELEKDLKRTRGARRLPWLLAGLVLGVAGTILLPRYAGPYLPFGGGGELLSGPVLAEEREDGRLLLTIDAAQGAFIASFSRRVSEIGLLVEPGDTVTLSVPDYDPFVEDPDFEGVRKRRATGVGSEGRPDSVATAEPMPRAVEPDTAPLTGGADADTAPPRADPAGAATDTGVAEDSAPGAVGTSGAGGRAS